MLGKIVRFIALALILQFALTGSPLAVHAQSYSTPKAAFQAALSAYNAQHGTSFEIVLTRQSGGFAYATATATADPNASGDAFLAILASNQNGKGWTALVPGDSASPDYNLLLDQFPGSLIDESTKALLHVPEPKGAPLPNQPSGSEQMLANYNGYKLPWRYGILGYVTQIDTEYHMSQVDFDIQGLAASGDVIASKPGTVVFVKQSSDTTCGTPAPDPCWKKANMVVIQHASGEYSWYVHLAHNSVTVSVGQTVGYGVKLGVEGKTGYSTGVHLHFMASSGHTAWTDPNNPNDAPWATGINPVDFIESPWSGLVAYNTYTSQNAANLPTVCPAAGGVLLYRDAQYGCAGQLENSGYALRTGPGSQDLPAGLDDAVSSMRIPTGWSVEVYESAGRKGGKMCINAPGDPNFADNNPLDSGTALDNKVSSFEVFSTPGCPTRTPADLTAPDGDFTSPAGGVTVGRSVQLAASAGDNAGGSGAGDSGIQSVRFTAKWGGVDHIVATDTNSPFAYTWDLCAAGVPDGDIELSLQVIDNAWNTFHLSSKHANPHITKAYDCSSAQAATWSADYWANPGLTGSAELNQKENGSFLFRNWGSAGPGSGIPADGWSARFTRTVNFPGGEYRFHCQSSSPGQVYGCRISLDGQERLSAWQNAEAGGADWTGTLAAGNHEVKVEYYDGQGDASLEAWWQGPGFLSRDTACENGQWCVDVWGNASLTGTAVLHRNEGETLAHDWGSSGADPLLSAAPFSIRAVRSANFDCGTYRFHATTSGGLRFWLDDAQRLDQWTEPGLAASYTVDTSLERGEHLLKVEHSESSGPASLSLWWEKLNDCPATIAIESASTHFVRPGAAIEPAVRVRVTSGYLDPARGDSLVLVSGSALGANAALPVRSFVNTGETYTFDSSNGLRMTAPTASGTTTSQWKIKIGGNTIGEAASIWVTADNQVPQISLSAPAGYLTAASIPLQATAQDATSGISHVQFFAGYNAGSGWAWHSLDWDLDGSNGWSVAWDASKVPDQTKVSFYAQAWDLAGNGNGIWPLVERDLDRTPPTAAMVSPAANQDSTRFLVQWTASDNISGVDHVDLQVQTDGGAWQNWIANQKGSGRSAWYTGALDHTYAFRIRAGDVAGNVSSYSNPSQATHINPCSPDGYEPDDSAASARTIQVDDSAQTHNLCGAGDQDWFVFQATAGSTYLIRTDHLGLTSDTVLTLYAADKTTKLAENDNITTLPDSFLLWTAASDGPLYIKARHADPNVAGNAVTYHIWAANARLFYLPMLLR